MRGLMLVLSWWLVGGAWAQSAPAVPEVLAPWVAWVLEGHEAEACPSRHDDGKARACVWPGRLSLDLDGSGGRFEQPVEVFAPGWVALPGEAKRWPVDVTLDGDPAPVADRNGVPSLWLEAGRHDLAGRFEWSALPESLDLPATLGLVSLTLNGSEKSALDRDRNGRIWLRDGRPVQRAAANRLAVKVHRKVIDDIPLLVVTRLELDVSGEAREEALGPALLPDALPLALEGPLPARLDDAGRLNLQVRPGRWAVELTARLPGPVDALPLASLPAPWPDEEVWVFEAREHLRVVEVEGAPPLDPRQTTLPEGWRELPAYRMAPGDSLRLTTRRRGEGEPGPDRLRLSRNLWLDFDGGGYTLQDTLTGTLTRRGRLALGPPFTLGRADVNGDERFVTRAQENEGAGLEVRRGELRLGADARLEGGARTLPAVGWDREMRGVETTLNLPPGWRLAAAFGPDRIAASWITDWTLLDLFLVLITALAVGRLWSPVWGLLALAALVLTWHEPWAPRWAWLHVLAAIALLRVAPPGWLQRIARTYRNLALLGLVLIALPFAFLQVRGALHPQLERTGLLPIGTLSADLGGMGAVTDQAAAPPPEPSRSAKMEQYLQQRVQKLPYPEEKRKKQARLAPDLKVTTGPGLPDWQWQRVRLAWSGPVAVDEALRLWLLPAPLNGALKVLGVLLVAALAWLVLRRNAPPPRKRPEPTEHVGGEEPPEEPGAGSRAVGGAAAAVLALALAFPLLGHAGGMEADLPEPDLLDELRERLLAPADCLPHCAQSPRLELVLAGERVLAEMEVHALARVAVPLPGDAEAWTLEEVSLDGEPALVLGDGATLRILVPQGVHRLRLAARLGDREVVPIPLPLRPHRVQVRTPGWRVEGVGPGGVPEPVLQLRRERPQPTAEGEPGGGAAVPPFARVQRELVLGLDWHTITRVSLDPRSQTGMVLEVPLLPGESVTSAGVTVRDGKVAVSLGPARRQLAWRAELAPSVGPGDAITLSAPRTRDWVETWRLDADPLWHVEMDGIPLLQPGEGQSRPTWRPWPGESVTLSISRPRGVEGTTLTVDRSSLEVQPGRRALRAELAVSLRSSQGGQYALTLPEGAEAQSMSLDGRSLPLRQDGRQVRFPLYPGETQVRVAWREPRGVGWRMDAPRVDLATPSVNHRLHLKLPRDRWVLYASGPRLGPAVLFWPLLAVLVVLALGLGRSRITPLGAGAWLLLGLGLTQAPVYLGVLVVGWLLALGYRRRLPEDTSRWRFNLTQIALALLTVAALSALLAAIKQGLLGLPSMQVAGLDSSAYRLNWYQDRSAPLLPAATVYSVPLLVYRGLMLAWALWLAFALLGWLRWGWQSYASGGLWRKLELSIKRR